MLWFWIMLFLFLLLTVLIMGIIANLPAKKDKNKLLEEINRK